MILSEFKKEQVKIKKAFREKAAVYILTAFGLVAGLAWNEAIKSFIEVFFPLSSGGVFVKFLYAVLVTTLLVFITVYIIKPPSK